MHPQNAPDSGVAAALRSVVRSPEPANALKQLVMTLMPWGNRPTPPSTEVAVDIRHLCLRGQCHAHCRHFLLLRVDLSVNSRFLVDSSSPIKTCGITVHYRLYQQVIGITVPDWRPAWLRPAVPFTNVVQDMRIEPRSKGNRPSVGIAELSRSLPATPREPVRHRSEERKRRSVRQQSFFHESLHHRFV
jgi:hypothetical protein